MRFASDVRSDPGPRERVCGTRSRRERRARWGRECRRLPSRGLLPDALLRSSNVRGFGASLSAVPSCPSLPLAPRSGISSSATFGDPRFATQMGTLRFAVAPCRQPSCSPQLPHFLPGADPRAAAHSRSGPCPGRPAAVPGPPPSAVTCSSAPGPRAGGRRPGRQRALLVQKCGTARAGRGRLGEEPCRCILFSKKIKYFHGKLSLCVFLPPSPCPSVPFSWVVFQGQLRVSFPGVPTLQPSPGCLWVWPSWGPGCVEAGTPLYAICAAFISPSRAEGGSEDGRLAAGPRVSHSSLSASCAFLLFRPSLRSVPQAPDTP